MMRKRERTGVEDRSRGWSGTITGLKSRHGAFGIMFGALAAFGLMSASWAEASDFAVRATGVS
ncbi:MAG: hypothetical protein E8D45_02565, partial [Nitrospira sp.]